tara:strand:+ start:818 stop:934 length:117 start_codon:yes stop_codon:yes gene_type:complete
MKSYFQQSKEWSKKTEIKTFKAQQQKFFYLLGGLTFFL